jgi:hypothetical protein
MISTKRRTIVNAMMQENKNYSDFIPKALESYIKSKYKCSLYLARLCVQDLISKNNEVQERP